MAPKKTRKLVQKTVVEETTQDLDVPPEPMKEEEQDHSEDEEDRASLEEHESEEEQPNGVLFTSEQLEVLLKMNRPDFSELVEVLKGGSSKSVGFKPARLRNFDGARDRKVVDAWLAEMEDDVLPSHGVKHTRGFHKAKLRKVELGSTLPASNSRKG